VKILKSLAKIAFTEVPPKLQRELLLHSDELLELSDAFRETTLWKERKLVIYTFYETQAMAKLGQVVSSTP